ncbi:MAG TPA: FKBP-type peptidyl-prolyl cis-trans isomerase [Solirubrobacteraceae bacterium]|nr:FKBP-type peptidyl-prolyl cis-trans isomerase [Solirubrobacteraceae bacterium]
MRKPLTLLIAAGALGVAVAGCGSSRVPGIVPAPSAGATAASTTATVSTPTSGPLSKEPTIAAGRGAPPTHLVEKDLITGTGRTAKPGDTVVVNYVGALYKTGKVFDASWKNGSTFTTQLSPTAGIIQGWVKGIVGMKVGGRRQLIIPPSLAYGKAGRPPQIPGNATLIFDVDLLKVSK